jgi:hypothetical protein
VSSSERPGAGSAPRRGGALILVLILIAALVGAVFVYRARTPDLALEIVSLERTITRGEDRGTFTFFVRFDEPDATIAIVGRNGREARTLATGFELTASERVKCVWDGRGDQGLFSRPGSYRVRVELPSENRDMIYPRRISVVLGSAIGNPGFGARPASTEPPCAPVEAE